MDAICDSQKRLEDANASLRQGNERLRNELQKKEKQGNLRGLRNSRRSSTIEIIKQVYCKPGWVCYKATNNATTNEIYTVHVMTK